MLLGPGYALTPTPSAIESKSVRRALRDEQRACRQRPTVMVRAKGGWRLHAVGLWLYMWPLSCGAIDRMTLRTYAPDPVRAAPFSDCRGSG